MTLLDYFAGRAIQGLLASPRNWDKADLEWHAYNAGERMIQEKERRANR